MAELVASNKQKQQAFEAQVAILKNERAKLDVEIGKYANSTAELGITIEASSQTPAEQLHARLSRVQQEINELNQQIQEIDSAVAVAARRSPMPKISWRPRIAELTTGGWARPPKRGCHSATERSAIKSDLI